jgi:hypothetical protein
MVVSGDDVIGNGGTGIQMDGCSDFSTEGNNHVHDNGGDGIRATSYAPTTFGKFTANNTAKRNGNYGIYVDPGMTDGGGNVARNNVNPVQCANIVCSLH